MRTVNNDTIRLLQFNRLSENKAITHFITTRHGGISSGQYASFNVGEYCGDNPSAVIRNREILCNQLGIPASLLYVPLQVHGDTACVIDTTFLQLPSDEQKKQLEGIDALITSEPNICIGVTTADCVPILLYATDKKVVAAIHAGWRGTARQIVTKTIHRMIDLYGCNPKQILAGIGPSISVEAYEVGEEVVQAFIDAGLPTESIVKRNTVSGKSHLDLWKANQQQLMDAGVIMENIETAGICTYTHTDDFFSARRLGIKSGRMISCILINEHPV